ncbi:transglycosylase SLT domain-containing protein [Massilia eburnea]|uniref:transglycosylase SLT domain-containing protein n=1 Tax=Massilia eburnea TaxID=1776165 RepID=UPI003D6AB7DF
MVKIESGFNPDAAAGTTSASGLGQFINDTGRAYGLNNTNRFDVNASVKAVVKYFLANEKLAKKNKKPDVWVYKYHHDGPTRDYGGEALATGKFAKLADAYEKALEVGHALSVVDAAGAPIADATIKVEQNGKSAVMKTNEHGLLPTFMASPDFGPLTIYIQKASDDFKELGQLAIEKLNSAWTIVAPKERIPVKTHVHVDKPSGARRPRRRACTRSRKGRRCRASRAATARPIRNWRS